MISIRWKKTSLISDSSVHTRRILALCAAIVVAAVLVIGASEARADRVEERITVFFNVDEDPVAFVVDPLNHQGTTLVQMRPLFEGLGMDVSWNAVSRQVSAKRDGVTLELKPGEETATVNGRAIALQVPAVNHEGHVMVPLRFIGESTGAYVHWDPVGRSIVIVTADWMEDNGVTIELVKALLVEEQAKRNAEHAAQRAEEANQPQTPVPPAQPGTSAKVNLNALTGMYYGGAYDYGGYECGGICWVFYTFLPDNRVVVGEIAGGGPETVDCKVDKCRTYAIKNGQLVIEGQEALTIGLTDDGMLEIDEVRLRPVSPMPEGTRMNGEYISQGYHGLVGITPFSSSWTDTIKFYSDGRFESDSSSIASLNTGVARTDSVSSEESVSGRYAINRNTITLTYDDGRTERFVYAVQPPRDDGRVYVQIGNRSFHLKS
ncbi:copper amine oxidase N-terminal domain-containing protein [Paenibacillus sp. 1P07SE]|uniref:copper amine oxidase N-terminal domain-containing protein n=1 Tax=Paenibacillus sp. 1P07SE TaxID=3132209 RepID=UPI0039A76E07